MRADWLKPPCLQQQTSMVSDHPTCPTFWCWCLRPFILTSACWFIGAKRRTFGGQCLPKLPAVRGSRNLSQAAVYGVGGSLDHPCLADLADCLLPKYPKDRAEQNWGFWFKSNLTLPSFHLILLFLFPLLCFSYWIINTHFDFWYVQG